MSTPTGLLRVLTVVGAGPGVGASLARRFGRQGYVAGLITRDRGRLDKMVHNLAHTGVQASAAAADAREPGS